MKIQKDSWTCIVYRIFDVFSCDKHQKATLLFSSCGSINFKKNAFFLLQKIENYKNWAMDLDRITSTSNFIWSNLYFYPLSKCYERIELLGHCQSNMYSQ